MLRLDPETLLAEVQQAKKFLAPYLETRAKMIRRSAGNHYRVDVGDSNDPGPPEERTPENYLFAYKQFVKPQLVHGKPLCIVTPTRAVTDKEQADALKIAINFWAKETGFKHTLSRVIDDMFFGFGVTKCGIAERGVFVGKPGGLEGVEGDFEQVPSFPFCIRIDPRDFVIDYRARALSEARFIGHRFERDLEDVLSDPQYDRGAVSQVAAFTSKEDNKQRPFPIPSVPDSRSRESVSLLELYIPEHGIILTMAESPGKLVVIRNAKYHGPDEGPYDIWGLDEVAGELLPISPLMALYDQFLELQAHAIASAKSAGRHKKIGVFQAAARADADRIVKAEPGDMVPTMDPQSVREIEIGGASQYQLGFLDFLRARLDRNLGFTDAQRGFADPSTTATASSIASSSSDLRIDGMRDRVADRIAAVYRKVGWYFFNDDSIGRLELSVENPETGQIREGVFISGRVQDGVFVENVYFPPPPQSDYVDYSFEIDPSTMTKQTDAIMQKRAQDNIALMMQLAPLMSQIPYVNWRYLLDTYGQAFNIKNFSRIVLRDDFPFVEVGMLEKMQAQQQQSLSGGTARDQSGHPLQSSPPAQGQTAETLSGIVRNARSDIPVESIQGF